MYNQGSTINGHYMHVHRQFYNVLLHRPLSYPDEPMKLLLLNGNTLVEIEDRDELVRKKLDTTKDRDFFNFYHNAPHLIQ